MYTKGEWRQSKVHTDTVWVDGRNKAICYCYAPDSEANANLIAAAPKLVEALRDWVERQDEWGDFVPPDARQALAKVEGK